jgi:hypothetical protein
MLGRWRRFSRALVVGAALLASAPSITARTARADGDPEPPDATDRVVKIGPQAVVIVDESGKARMYDDPAEQAPACKSTLDCWGKALGILSGFAILTYEDWTTNTEGGARTFRGGD